ncbi:MAG: class I SAM-dependent rRNA methyltransferase [Planctomycetota bacterium]|jgi:23S rRNA (cytosine1962-C5)-methyltransferase
MEEASLIVTQSGWKRIMAGHPWIFRDDLVSPPAEGQGKVACLLDHKSRFMGRGFYNPDSRIAFRLITREDRPVDAAFWRERLEAALRYRDSLSIESTARRLVYSEADGFPGLIVDDYGGCLVLQILTLGMERIRDQLIELLDSALSPAAMVLRNDSPVRRLEGLEQETAVLSGSLPDPLVIQEGDLRFAVDLLEGQKTGAYLDQRDNRLALRSFAEGKRVLDAFCYDGWFALHLAGAGASEVIALDSSSQALERLGQNAGLNGIENVEARKANCFDALKALARDEERFDLIVLDPPPFARRKADIGGALSAYREINSRAIRCLNPGGLLFTCCCSHGISQDRFSGVVAAAAGRARRKLLLLEQQLQPKDHPILFNEPESLYLKGMLFTCL